MMNLVVIYFSFLLCLPGIHTRHGKKENRIINGANAGKNQLPYQAEISILEDRSHCSGSIISKNTILSAAHCFENVLPRDVQVFLGNTKLHAGDKYVVKRIIPHEGYLATPTSVQNDIAILKLEKDVTFKENIKNITLEVDDVGIVEAVVSGWGFTDIFAFSRSDTLQYFATKTISNVECKKKFFNAIRYDVINDKQVCTETNVGGSCDGDSGGPLVSKGKQVGVTSFLVNSTFVPCYTDLPRVYTKVSAYIDWINSYI